MSESLRHRGCEIFLPTYLECRPYSDRTRKVFAALFPGYLFCRLDPSHRRPVLMTPGVERIVGVGVRPVSIPDAEIAAIQRIVKTCSPAIHWPYLAVGHKIRIEHGALAGLEGLVVKVRNSDRLIRSVNLLQRSVCVEMDRGWIRPLDSLQPFEVLDPSNY